MNTKSAVNKELAALTPMEAAAHWFVRQDAQQMTAADRQEFEHWLAAAEAHRQAYEQTSAMWLDFEAAADAGELRALRVAALASGPAPKVWPRAAAIAGVALGALGIAALVLRPASQPYSGPTPYASATAVHYTTANNQRSTVRLPDGTQVFMNLDTVLAADFTSGKRVVYLTRGQAFFEVAKDTQRPFIVAAGDRHIQALGTQFDVRLGANRVEVVLLEGRVSVEPTSRSWLDRVARRASHVELAPNQRLVAAMGRTATVEATNAQRATSWRDGWLMFEDETLQQAIAELNRYSEHPLVAPEAAVRQLRFSGVFRVGQPERFAAIIQELLPVRVERGTGGETLLLSKSGAAQPY
jgi:transmembrane sensor